MALPTSAEHGREAIHAAGKAVNHLDLSTPDLIRRAIPIARRAAREVKSWSESGGDKDTGDFTGLHTAIYQNWLYEQNREWHFTDGTLCVLWAVELPHADCDYAERHRYIRSTRTDYNAGRHQAPEPQVPCVSYDRNGDPIVSRRSSARAVKEAPPHVGAIQTAGIATPSASLTRSSPPSSAASTTPPLSRPTVNFQLASDPTATRRRLVALDGYMAAHVLGSAGFQCAASEACRASHPGKFFEGQLHHVGSHYDLFVDGRPFRIAVVGQEYGNGPGLVRREQRSRVVVVETGQQKRFLSDGGYPARNPHMRGTTSLLRLLFGRPAGRDYDGEWLPLGGTRVHIFEAFALTNFLLCSAIGDDEGETGSKRGQSTATMQHNCAKHFATTARILEPTVVVAQGVGVRRWIEPLLDHVTPISANLERVSLAGQPCVLATFTHPSVPSALNWGTDERRPYLVEVVAPTVQAIHQAIRS